MGTEGWWIAAGTLIVGWATWVTRRSFGALTRQEHEAICQTNQTETTAKLNEILDKLTASDKQAIAHRDAITVQVGVMESKVAVLKDRSDRAEGETAAQRRRRVQRNST